MSDLMGLKLSKSEVSQKFNLADLLSDTIPSDVLADVIDEVKDSFVRKMIEAIEERTLNGQDVDGKKFKPYSKEYADDKGVSVSDVDLYRDGSMFDSIREMEVRGKFNVKIGIDDEDEVLKAYNHNVGDTLPKRQFFGITNEEAKEFALEALDER